MFDSLGLSPADQRALDDELAARVALYHQPVSLAELFTSRHWRRDTGTWLPTWAADACDRLTLAGRLVELPDGTVRVADRAGAAA